MQREIFSTIPNSSDFSTGENIPKGLVPIVAVLSVFQQNIKDVIDRQDFGSGHGYIVFYQIFLKGEFGGVDFQFILGTIDRGSLQPIPIHNPPNDVDSVVV